MNTATKTARPPKRGGFRLPLGNHPGNTGGKKGRSGRKPDEFKAMCRALASSKDVEKAVITALKNPQHPAFLGALKWATEHGYGAATKSLDVTTGGKPISGVVVLPASEE